jgi:hypothetical protein
VKILRIILIVAAALFLVWSGARLYFEYVANPRIVRELIANPGGEQAKKVMLLTLPSGRRIPVNYLREQDRVYAAADGTWWKELVGDGAPVKVLVQGSQLNGRARAVLDDPAHTEAVFARLRPTAVPGFGTLIEVRLEDARSTRTE